MKWKIPIMSEGLTIKSYLREEKKFSRRLLASFKNGGSIRVNGTKRPLYTTLREGDVLEIEFPTEKVPDTLEKNSIPLNIVHEDEACLVLFKKAGMATTPSLRQPSHTLANGILSYYEERQIPSTVHIVTRLDTDTSGLVLVAKNRYVHYLFANLHTERQVMRHYTAIVHGKLAAEKGTIRKPIGRQANSIIERTVRGDGKEAVTHYEVLCELGEYSVVGLTLETGRTHQIRVHLQAMGHPLVGDELYGGNRKLLGRQALHCERLSFPHPLTQEELSFNEKMPADMQAFIRQIKQYPV